MKRNILMVYPANPKDTYWSFSYALPFIGKKAAMPPLGIITVAAMLPEYCNVKVTDMNVEQLKDDDILWADAVFTSAMVVQKDSLNEVIEKVKSLEKKYSRKIPIVAGGPHPTQYYDQIKGVDHFILGEAESGVLDAFMADFEQQKPKKVYARHVIRKKPGEKEIDEKSLEELLCFFEKEDSDISVVNERPSMQLSPVPRFDLLNPSAYMSMALQGVRGCPYSCEFCNEPTLFGHKPRFKETEKMIEELEKIYGLGFQGSVFYVDDNFVGNKNKLKLILPKIIEFQEKYDYPYSLYTEADITLASDDKLMELMRDAGFGMAFIGLESPEEEVLRSMGKNHNMKINLSEAVRKIQSFGIEVAAGFIVGNDPDPENICEKIFEFCQKQGIATAMAGLLTAVKGSVLYERLKQEGRLRNDTAGNNTHNFSLNFEPPPVKQEKKIIHDYKNLLSRLYDKCGENYFRRCSVLLDRLGYSPKPARTTGFAELKAFAKSIWMQSWSSYGAGYRKFILDALRRHRDIFPRAVRLAMCGEHFINITKYSLQTDDIKEELVEKADYFNKLSELVYGRGWRRLEHEANKFLRKAGKRIHELPREYRDTLIELYEHVTSSFKIRAFNKPHA
jgi:radical SAM superfamily enzyme YgiQ (UPF0313 family)